MIVFSQLIVQHVIVSVKKSGKFLNALHTLDLNLINLHKRQYGLGRHHSTHIIRVYPRLIQYRQETQQLLLSDMLHAVFWNYLRSLLHVEWQ